MAEGAERALALMREANAGAEPFDVMLLDLNMLGTDGYGLAAMVSAEPDLAHTPIVLLTSSAKRGEAERAKRTGIVAYLTKPVRSAQLRGVLGSTLGANAAGTPRPTVTRSPDPSAPRLADDAAIVLIVEDNVVNRKVLTGLLASLGYRSDVAVNGVDALEAMDGSRYAAIFMDCQLPMMDGYESTERLGRRGGDDRNTCVIAVTATAMDGDRDRCMAAGMDDYLTKPISLGSLAAVMDRWAPDRSAG